MSSKENKIFITMQELMEQMDISDKTLYRMIEAGDLPDFTYGSRWSRKKGWHVAVLERHAMNKYEQSESLKNAGRIGKVAAENMSIPFLCHSNRAMSKKQTDLDDGDSSKKKLSGKEMTKGVRSSRYSRVATGF